MLFTYRIEAPDSVLPARAEEGKRYQRLTPGTPLFDRLARLDLYGQGVFRQLDGRGLHGSTLPRRPCPVPLTGTLRKRPPGRPLLRRADREHLSCRDQMPFEREYAS
jgi:hypothetical protein